MVGEGCGTKHAEAHEAEADVADLFSLDYVDHGCGLGLVVV